jgi:hypothetical protein
MRSQEEADGFQSLPCGNLDPKLKKCSIGRSVPSSCASGCAGYFADLFEDEELLTAWKEVTDATA